MLKRAFVVGSLVAILFLLFQSAIAQTEKKKVTSQADLPRFTYPLSAPASDLLQADLTTFNVFAAKVRSDVDDVLRDYDITDKATMRDLLSTKLNLQQLAGEYPAALETVKTIRGLEEKPSARLTSGLFTESLLRAAIDTNGASGPTFEQAFTRYYSEAVNKLPWDVVQDSMKSAWAGTKLRGRASLIAYVKTELDPAAEKSKSLSNDEAWQLIAVRKALQVDLPVKDAHADVLGKYVTAHNVMKPDIWQAREVTLTPADKLTPVLLGIWDSGVTCLSSATRFLPIRNRRPAAPTASRFWTTVDLPSPGCIP
jgi:hypothetical protein